MLDGSGRNVLQWAVFVRSAVMVEELLRLGADPASYSDRGHTAIHFAVKASALEMLPSLVKHGPEKVSGAYNYDFDDFMCVKFDIKLIKTY